MLLSPAPRTSASPTQRRHGARSVPPSPPSVVRSLLAQRCGPRSRRPPRASHQHCQHPARPDPPFPVLPLSITPQAEWAGRCVASGRAADKARNSRNGCSFGGGSDACHSRYCVRWWPLTSRADSTSAPASAPAHGGWRWRSGGQRIVRAQRHWLSAARHLLTHHTNPLHSHHIT